MRTCQSDIHVAQVARTQAFLDGQLLEVRRHAVKEPGYIGQELTIDLPQGQTSWVLARLDRPRSMTFFAEALQSDVTDIQHGTTSEGLHLGAMAGTVDLIQRVSTGIEVKGDVLRLNPELPREIQCLNCASAIAGIQSICS